MASYTSAASAILTSPTFTSISTASSFDMADSRSRSSTLSAQSFSLADDSDDEIVWTVSSDYHSSDDISTESSASSDDDDFVVLRRPRSLHAHSGRSTPGAVTSHTPSSGSRDLISGVATLTLNPQEGSNIVVPSRSKGRVLTASVPSPTLEIAPKPKLSRRQRRAKKQAGLGARPIVDDVSEDLSTDRDDDVFQPSVYEEAVRYVTSFIRNPAAYDSSSSRLVLLQSIIIELGLATSTLPASLNSAKALLKSHAFLNIRDYLAVRDQGLDAVKQVMYPSRTALIKSIRKQPQKRASLGWVKEHGLQVLLVSAYRH